MEQSELEQLDTLLHKLRQDSHVMEGLSVLEQQEISGASEAIFSLIRRHLKPPGGAQRQVRNKKSGHPPLVLA